jgi:phytoene dehydrogenase-like protein
MISRFDAIIIGGGHNGLVAAATLAKAGRKVVVIEARDTVGGAAATREFAPGFKVSAVAHLLNQMPESLIKDLDLPKHGLSLAASGLPSWSLSETGPAVRLDQSGLTGADAEGWARFDGHLSHFAKNFRGLLERVPPRFKVESLSDALALGKIGWEVKRLGKTPMREFLRIVGMNIYDLLDEHFDSHLVKGALGFDAVLGSNFGPRSPGTVLTYITRRIAQATTGEAGHAVPKGGLGAVSAALAAAARAAGAEIRTGLPVSRVIIENDRAAGVILESGERVEAPVVVSNADPKRTFLSLVGTEYLDTGFVRRIRHLRTQGLTAKLHLALDHLPEFKGLDPAANGGRLVIAPSLDYVERAYNHSKYREFSDAPALEITIPTLADPSLAPSGKHVLSAVVQYAPHKLDQGWDSGKPVFTQILLDLLERHAPGIAKSVVGNELLTPLDIEREFHITGGHWHHADLAFDQFYVTRPVPGLARHRTPIQGLFLCGAGCHPGGGVMGIAGRNAATQVLSGAA